MAHEPKGAPVAEAAADAPIGDGQDDGGAGLGRRQGRGGSSTQYRAGEYMIYLDLSLERLSTKWLGCDWALD